MAAAHFEEGSLAYRRGESLEDNPYELGSVASSDWHDGWECEFDWDSE